MNGITVIKTKNIRKKVVRANKRKFAYYQKLRPIQKRVRIPASLFRGSSKCLGLALWLRSILPRLFFRGQCADFCTRKECSKFVRQKQKDSDHHTTSCYLSTCSLALSSPQTAKSRPPARVYGRSSWPPLSIKSHEMKTVACVTFALPSSRLPTRWVSPDACSSIIVLRCIILLPSRSSGLGEHAFWRSANWQRRVRRLCQLKRFREHGGHTPT